MNRISNIASDSIGRKLSKQIEEELSVYGIYCRVFVRIKSTKSLLKKLDKKNYDEKNKLQDFIGVRIATYFKADIDVCDTIISNMYENVAGAESIDLPTPKMFSAKRYNKVYKLPDEISDELLNVFNKYPIDSTFEVQYRTIFSEGWHEVEHDLRYKANDDWEGYDENLRTLHGLYATLETCDWAIESLFDDLSFKHYKSKNWKAMIKTKYRIKFEDEFIEEELFRKITEEQWKKIYRCNKTAVINQIAMCKIKLPLTFMNYLQLIIRACFDESEIENLVDSQFNKLFDEI